MTSHGNMMTSHEYGGYNLTHESGSQKIKLECYGITNHILLLKDYGKHKTYDVAFITRLLLTPSPI